MILASTFSAAYLLVPRYILSAALAVLLRYPDMRSSLAYVLLIFVLMLVPPALSRWALRAASPMLDYFDFESATIRDRIDAAFSGDIAFLFDSAMQVRRLKQNSSSTYINPHGSAQLAADNDDFRTAVSRACASQSIATIGPQNILHVEKLYTQPVPPLGHPPPSSCTPHQSYCLPGDICDTIRHAAKNKGAGINADSIDIFTSLLKRPNHNSLQPRHKRH